MCNARTSSERNFSLIQPLYYMVLVWVLSHFPKVLHIDSRQCRLTEYRIQGSIYKEARSIPNEYSRLMGGTRLRDPRQTINLFGIEYFYRLANNQFHLLRFRESNQVGVFRCNSTGQCRILSATAERPHRRESRSPHILKNNEAPWVYEVNVEPAVSPLWNSIEG